LRLSWLAHFGQHRSSATASKAHGWQDLIVYPRSGRNIYRCQGARLPGWGRIVYGGKLGVTLSPRT
jgi:hypothetical protein